MLWRFYAAITVALRRTSQLKRHAVALRVYFALDRRFTRLMTAKHENC